MTTAEFSSEFDVLYNNIMSNSAPGLDEYEKSVFLTAAQKELVLNHFNLQGNKYREGFDNSPKRQMDFSELVTTASISTVLTTVSALDRRGILFELPEKVLLILNEIFTYAGNTYQVSPLNFEEYSRLMNRPYKSPLKNQVWRLIKDSLVTGRPVVEIIPSKGNPASPVYTLNYIRIPNPIILTILSTISSTLTIDGIAVVTECELNPIIHRQILNRAVELAKMAFQGDLNTTVSLNQRDE